MTQRPADGSSAQPLLYTDLADWFHLLTHPDDYAEEAAEWLRFMTEALGRTPATTLELGSGGGNNASHMKGATRLTLADLSPAMLALSRRINPECEHLVGDMRSARLNRTFDAVFIHDAICYIASEDDLRRTFETALLHCAPGGVALFVPDEVRESFKPATDSGGRDALPGAPDAGRALRYLEWTWDPDPSDDEIVTDFAYLLRERDGSTRALHDRHRFGLFSRTTWLGLMTEAGFVEATLRETPIGSQPFVARRPR
jgi:SAM-dependent methyltransferase